MDHGPDAFQEKKTDVAVDRGGHGQGGGPREVEPRSVSEAVASRPSSASTNADRIRAAPTSSTCWRPSGASGTTCRATGPCARRWSWPCPAWASTYRRQERFFNVSYRAEAAKIDAIAARFVAHDLFSPLSEQQAPLLFAIERDVHGRKVGPN